MVFPAVRCLDIPRCDANDMHARDKRQAADMPYPRAAMNAEWVTHVVRMVIENDDLYCLVKSGVAANQPMAEVMEIATAEEGNAGLENKRIACV